MEYIYIDSNVWNFLYKNDIDLKEEFPENNYELRIVGEQILENRSISHDPILEKYIANRIELWEIKIDRIFGFFNDHHSTEDQRVGGYEDGRYIGQDEEGFILSYKGKVGDTKRKSGLYRNEADLSLAARSVHSIVLTLDTKGPLKWAKQQGFLIVDLTDFCQEKCTLKAYVERKC